MLDVSGDARFRVNEHNNLLIYSENEDARIDFTRDDYGSVITPTASIVFDASDPITHTTSILFYTQGPDDPSSNSIVEIGENGNLRPAGNNRYALGEPGKRWTTVYTVNGIDMSSDGRLKDNITTLPYGLEQIKQLQPVEFTWKDATVDDIRFGLIAKMCSKCFQKL